jgi:hypothetical protein
MPTDKKHSPASPGQAPSKAKPQSEAKRDEVPEKDLDKVSGGIGSQSTGAGAGKVTFNPF